MNQTPSQTVGPFLHLALPYDGGQCLVLPDDPEAIVVHGHVIDGAGDAVADALIEIWQADADGRYDTSSGFGRCATDSSGRFEFVTREPGPVPHPDGTMQAPHIAISVFARGLLDRIVTRCYLPTNGLANHADTVLSTVAPDRRAALVAIADERGLRFDIRLQGEAETPFFDV